MIHSRFLPAVLALVSLAFGTASSPQALHGADFVLGNLIEPFTPPPLAELDAKAGWINRDVLDGMDLMRARQAKEKPLTTVAEALKLKNNSILNNQKILTTLGRLPEKDSQVDWNASITRHTAGDVKSTNPVLGSSTIEFDVNGLTSMGLFGFDWTFRPYAAKDTVVSYQSSKDGLYDKVVMRNDLTWSDGTPITAHDVVFSYKLIMSKEVPVPAQRHGTDKLKWIEAYDDHTLVYFHKESLATNVWNVNFSIIPKHIYEKSVAEDPTLQSSAYHVKYENNPVTGGAYVISDRTRGQEIVLTARESWYKHQGKEVRDRPHFKTVRFKVIQDTSVALLGLKGGDIDEMILNPEQWRTQTTGDDFYKNNTKGYGLEWVYFYFGWNNKRPWFTDKRVRQAMSYAFDHKEMLEKLRFGLDEPCNGLFHKTSKYCPKNAAKPYTQDLDKAEELLDAAGWKDSDNDGIRDKVIDGKKVKFEFNIMTSNVPDRIEIANLLKQNLSEIGIICHVQPREFTVLTQKMQEHDFDANFGGWGTGADPDTSENVWGSGQDRNYGQYENKKVDELFAKGRKEFDPAKRAEIYAQIHTIIYEDQPVTFLYFRNAYYGFNKKLRGYVFSPRGPFNYGPGFSSIWSPEE